MSILSRLFGNKSAENAPEKEDVVTYEGFTITPAPIKEGNSYRVSAKIQRDVDGEMKEHLLIRADTTANKDEAIETSLRKAKQVIDEQGLGVFR